MHAERTIHKQIPLNDEHRLALDSIRGRIWDFYAELKHYKENPSAEKKDKLSKEFDTIFQEETCYALVNCALRRLYKNKKELLQVLDYPSIPLHNNPSESDIREYAKRRKVSGGARSVAGRKSRDTFISLKKTCRKLGISFLSYLKDRLTQELLIPPLPVLMQEKALAST